MKIIEIAIDILQHGNNIAMYIKHDPFRIRRLATRKTPEVIKVKLNISGYGTVDMKSGVCIVTDLIKFSILSYFWSICQQSHWDLIFDYTSHTILVIFNPIHHSNSVSAVTFKLCKCCSNG